MSFLFQAVPVQLVRVQGGKNGLRGLEAGVLLAVAEQEEAALLDLAALGEEVLVVLEPLVVHVSEMLRSVGLKTKVYTPFVCGSFTELFSKDAAVEALEAGYVTFFAGGTGHPYFSTDTGTSLRAIEIEADAILLAKAIDGVYDSDPKFNPDAKKYDSISLDEVLVKKLAVVDLTATIMCLENKMPMVVFGLNEENSIVNTVNGKFNGTYVTV